MGKIINKNINSNECIIKELLENNGYELTKEIIETKIKNFNYIFLNYKFQEYNLKTYLMLDKNPKLEIIKMLNRINFNGDEKIKYFNIINYYKSFLYCYFINKNIEKPSIEIIKYFSKLIGKKDDAGIVSIMCYLQFNKNPSVDGIELLRKEFNIDYDKLNNPLVYYYINENVEDIDQEIIKLFSK